MSMSTTYKSPNPKDPRMFYPTIDRIPPAFSKLLEKYSQIPQKEQVRHVTSIRNAAYDSHPYPCLGRFRFMDLDLSNHPLYHSHILPSLKSELRPGMEDEEPLYLDFGCCLGQDIRQALQDGVTLERIYGSDILPEFIDIGYDLFRDEGRFPRDHFIVPADAFDGNANNPLSKLDGRVSILHISAVFHLFGLDPQQNLATRCLKLLNRKAGRCLILGAQTANLTAGDYPRVNGSKRWRHNEDSWRNLWEEAAKEATGCGVEVGVIMEERGAVIGDWRDEDVKGEDGVMRKERRKVVELLEEEGFRWMTWWVWVGFEG